MNGVLTLYDLADECGITIDYFNLDETAALSLREEHACYIAIDPTRIESEIDEKIKLAHELGHCITGSFYCEYTPLDIREKHENHADRWAFRILIPQKCIRKALESGYREFWELAEYFDVPEDFIRRTLEYYEICG